MNVKNIKKRKDNCQKPYDYYIAIDWSIEGAAIARMRSNNLEAIVREISPNIKVIREYLRALKGKKILTIEETTGAQWLYVELKDSVDKIMICNPSRNRLLEEGPKNDKIDAGKLCQLLRAGLLKEVYHTDNEENYRIRKLVSTYDDLVKARVRLMNQHSAIYRAIGLKKKQTDQYDKKDKIMNFILEDQLTIKSLLDQELEKFEELFEQTVKDNEVIGYIKQISGFGKILSVKAYALILEAERFKNKYKLWSYGGLVKNKRESGKLSFKKRNQRYSRGLKSIFKMAAHAALAGKNDIRDYYEYLLINGYTPKDAYNEVTRYLATSVYAVMKNRTRYQPYHWRNKSTKIVA
jgi:hypothetical protein